MTKLEQIARALCQQDEQNGGAPWDYEMGGDPKWNRLRHERYFEYARTAVETLKVPTETMIEAVWEDADRLPETIIPAIVDAILNEKP